MRVRKVTLALAGTYFAGLALAVAGPHVLPPYFYFDSTTIRDLLTEVTTPIPGASYNNTALIYGWLGFGTLLPDALAGPIGYTAAFAATISAARLASCCWIPWLYAMFAIWNIPLAVYLGVYSKEVTALLVISAICWLSRSTRGIVAAAIVALAYAAMFRTYWAIVAVLWITILAVWRLGGGWTVRIAAAFVAVLPLSVAAHQFAEMWLTDGRTIVTDARDLVGFSATQFANFVPNASPFTDLVNTGIGWGMLMIPVFLLNLGGLQHVAFAGFQVVNVAVFVVAVRRMQRLRRPATPADWRMASAASFCVAFSIVQGMFEPDFGSFAKHETTLLPMLFYILAQIFGRSSPVPAM